MTPTRARGAVQRGVAGVVDGVDVEAPRRAQLDRRDGALVVRAVARRERAAAVAPAMPAASISAVVWFFSASAGSAPLSSSRRISRRRRPWPRASAASRRPAAHRRRVIPLQHRRLEARVRVRAVVEQSAFDDVDFVERAGGRESGRLMNGSVCMSTAAYNAAMPLASATLGSAPFSSSSAATSLWPLTIAITSALVPSGSGHVQIGAALGQRAHALQRTLPRGEHQRASCRRGIHVDTIVLPLNVGSFRTQRRARVDLRATLDRAARIDRRAWFWAAAHINAVSSLPFLRRVDLGAVRRAAPSRPSALPVRAAVISTVSPSGDAALASAPACEQQLDHRGVAVGGGQRERRDAVAVRGVRALAPALSSSRTVSTSSARTAQWSAVVPSTSAVLTVDARLHQLTDRLAVVRP